MKKLLSLATVSILTVAALNLAGGQIVKAATTSSDVSVTYTGHVQNVGWQNWVSDGTEAGTDGRSLRVEALKIKLAGTVPAGASIEYQGHVQNIGWQTPVSDGDEIGTDGKALRVEAIKIALKNLPGYSIQYRAHVQNIGWQSWVSDGQEAGTDGKGLRIEALQIKIVKTADGSTPIPVPFVDAKGNPISAPTDTTGGTTTTPTSITSISLNKTTDSLAVGGKDTLIATITPTDAPNKTITWTSSNNAVATVSNTGAVTAISQGSATITATTEDGNKTASCTVTVNASQSSTLTYFPLLPNIPQPVGVSYYGTTTYNDSKDIFYLYHASDLPDNFVYDYTDLLESNGWKYVYSSQTEGIAMIFYAKDNNVVGLGATSDSNLFVVVGTTN